MPILTYIIENITRINSLTLQITTVKKIKPFIDGMDASHHYIFADTVSDANAKVVVKSDLETKKGYGVLTEV